MWGFILSGKGRKKMYRSKVVIMALGVALLMGASVLAQSDLNGVGLEKIVVTPYKTEQFISDVNKAVTVITKKDIERSNANYLPELIQNQTGIPVSNYYGNPKGTVVDIRGFGESSTSNVLILVDGRRINQIDLSGADWGQVDLNSIERIEIVRGPMTVLYGDNASAGVINIITKRGVSKKPRVTLGSAIGSHQFKKVFTTVGGSSKLINYFFSSSHQESSGYRANNNYWENNFFGRTTIHPTNQFVLDLSSGYHRDHYGMPGRLYLSDIETVGRRGTVYPHDKGFTSDYFITATPKLSFSIGDADATISLLNTYRERRSNGLNVYALGVSEYETVHYILSYALRPKFEVNSSWQNNDNQFIIGIDYFHVKDNILSGNRVGNQQDETDIYKEGLGIYIHDNIEFSNRLLFNAGGRIEWADYTFDQKGIIANHSTKFIREGAMNFGLGYKYSNRSQIYFDYSRSYRMPNTEECYTNKYFAWGQFGGGLNVGIKHQQSNNYELGIKHNSIDWMTFSADIFLMDVKNEIYYDPTLFTNSNYRPMTRHYGLELEANFNLIHGKLRPFAFWTLQKSYFKGGEYANNLVPFVPRNKFSAGTVISPFNGFNWTISVNYMGSRHKISDQKNLAAKLKDYLIFGTAVDYTIKDVKLWFAIKNLFNKEHYAYGVTNSTGTRETFYPSPERRFEVGATFTF